MVQKTRKKVLRVMRWSEWAMRTGHSPDINISNDLMTREEFYKTID